MRYNFTDVNPTLFNLLGQQFYGKLVFVAPGTTKTYVNVYDVDGNNLGHEITTNQYGRLQTQILIEGTCDVQYWEYTGTLFDVEDDTQFTLIRTERLIDPATLVSVEIDGIASVSTTAALRELDTSSYSKGTVVIRTGYYQGGDHELLAYWWNPSSSSADNGGTIIQPDGVTVAGRWIAILPDHVNVKWFGVKTSSLKSTVTYQSSAMVAAYQVANRYGKTLYFPADYTNTFYGIDNVNINVGDADLRLDAGCRLVGKEGTSNSITCFNLYCDRDEQVILTEGTTDTFSVTAHEIWTASMNNYGAIVAEIVHWNDPIRQSAWENCTIYFETEPLTTMSFDNCVLSFESDSYKFAGSEVHYSFTDMQFTDKYFKTAPDYGYIDVDASCDTDIENFRSADNWFACMQSQNQAVINCAGHPMSDITLYTETQLHNVNINSLTVQEGYNLVINGGFLYSLTFSDATKNIVLNNASVMGTSASSISCNVLQAINTNMYGASDTIAAVDATFNRCSITSALTCWTFNASHSTFSSNVDVTFDSALSVVSLNNTFSGLMVIYRQAESTSEGVKAVGCKWIGNTYLGADTSFWIVMDRTYLDPDDTAHEYVYRDNVGGIQPGQRQTLQIKAYFYYNDDIGHIAVPDGDPFLQMYGQSYTSYIFGSPFSNMFVFSIGTTNVTVRLKFGVVGEHISSSDYSGMLGGVNTDHYLPFFMADQIRFCSTSDIYDYQDGFTPSGSSEQIYQDNILKFVSGYQWKMNWGTAEDFLHAIIGKSYMTPNRLPFGTMQGMDVTICAMWLDGRKLTLEYYVDKV